MDSAAEKDLVGEEDLVLLLRHHRLVCRLEAGLSRSCSLICWTNHSNRVLEIFKKIALGVYRTPFLCFV